jgi:hypothetical protein
VALSLGAFSCWLYDWLRKLEQKYMLFVNLSAQLRCTMPARERKDCELVNLLMDTLRERGWEVAGGPLIGCVFALLTMSVLAAYLSVSSISCSSTYRRSYATRCLRASARTVFFANGHVAGARLGGYGWPFVVCVLMLVVCLAQQTRTTVSATTK